VEVLKGEGDPMGGVGDGSAELEGGLGGWRITGGNVGGLERVEKGGLVLRLGY